MRRFLPLLTSAVAAPMPAAPPSPPAVTSLAATIAAVAHSRISLDADDVYRICMLVSGAEDTLRLRENADFMLGLWRARQLLPLDALPPFQAAIVNAALAGVVVSAAEAASAATQRQQQEQASGANVGGGDGSGGFLVAAGVEAADGDAHTPIVFTDQAVSEHIRALWDCVSLFQQRAYTPGDGRRVAEHCAALDPQLRKLSVGEVCSVTRALATLNFFDFNFSALLARRCCELAPKMTTRELCQTFFNLTKLNVQDSLIAVVRRIDAAAAELSWKDIYLVVQALERQQNTTAANTPLVPKLAARSAEVAKDVSAPHFYSALLTAIARYGAQRHPAVKQIARNAATMADRMLDRDLIPVLQAVVGLKLPPAEGSEALLRRAEALVPTMDPGLLAPLIDTLSTASLDSTTFMRLAMDRLAKDAGRVTVPQLLFLLDLLSSYPPVRGTPCAVALAFAANVKKDSLDRPGAERAVLALAAMGHFTDDFVAIADFLATKRRGLQNFDALAELLQSLTPGAAKEEAIVDVLGRLIEGLAPVINDEEMLQVRKLISAAGVTDKRVLSRIVGQARAKAQTFNKSIKLGKRYDPADDLV